MIFMLPLSCFSDVSNNLKLTVCIYFSYGIKSANGVNRISGEGLEANNVPGMLGGGGKWPGR